MKKLVWIKVVGGLAAIVFVGVGTYVILNRLDERMVNYLVGGLFVLVVFVVVGGLLIGKDIVQAYLMRRAIAQDDMSDMKQMVFLMKMMSGLRGPNVNVRLPEQEAQPQPYLLPGVWGQPQQQPPADVFDGHYTDATIDLE